MQTASPNLPNGKNITSTGTVVSLIRTMQSRNEDTKSALEEFDAFAAAASKSLGKVHISSVNSFGDLPLSFCNSFDTSDVSGEQYNSVTAEGIPFRRSGERDNPRTRRRSSGSTSSVKTTMSGPAKHRPREELESLKSFKSSDGGVSDASGGPWIPYPGAKAVPAEDMFFAGRDDSNTSNSTKPNKMRQNCGAATATAVPAVVTTQTQLQQQHFPARPPMPVRPPMPATPLLTASVQTSIEPVSTTLSPSVSETTNIYCRCCKKTTPHEAKRYSVHCRPQINLKQSYTSYTCSVCSSDCSVCPNHEHKEFEHSDSVYLQWEKVSSPHTTEKLWEMKCKICEDERLKRKTQTIKLAKLTIKWTRCNRCKALYKKGKGVKGVHSSDQCKIRSTTTSPATTLSPRQDEHIKTIKWLLDNNAFTNLRSHDEQLWKHLGKQCGFFPL